MTNLHVIYRLEERVSPGVPERWAAYSYPVSIYAAGSNIAEVRAEFREVFEDMVEVLGDEYELREHLERPLVDGAYVRTAIDRSNLDRAETAQLFEGTLNSLVQREDFAARAPMSGTGDTVVVACVGKDKIGWLMEQMNEHDSLVICLSTVTPIVWWTWLAGAQAKLNEASEGTITDAGLTPDSTVSDFVRADSLSKDVGRRPNSPSQELEHRPGLLVAAG